MYLFVIKQGGIIKEKLFQCRSNYLDNFASGCNPFNVAWCLLSNGVVCFSVFYTVKLLVKQRILTINDAFVIAGLVDTAVKTAETGYMQRRLVKVRNIYLKFKLFLSTLVGRPRFHGETF